MDKVVSIDKVKEIILPEVNGVVDEYRKQMTHMHLAKTNALIALMECPDSQIDVRCSGLKCYLHFKDPVLDALRMQRKELIKALNNEPSLFWDEQEEL